MTDRTRSAEPMAARASWPYQGRPQVLLLVAGLVTVAASFMPWLTTPLGDLSGGAGVWTFYAGVTALPGAIWRRAWVVLVHAVILAVPAVVLPLQRLLWGLGRLPGLGEAWLPGPGLVLVAISGGVATYAAVQLWRQAKAERP